MRFPPARVHPGVTQQHRFPAERKVIRLTSSSPLVWREQREEAEAEAEAGECSRIVLLVLLCSSLCLTAGTRTAAVHLLHVEKILSQTHSSCGVIPASTDFTPNEGSRFYLLFLRFFLKNHLDEEKAQSASELLGPDLFSSSAQSSQTRRLFLRFLCSSRSSSLEHHVDLR